ncbi:hypothetical protein ABFX02_09G109600 [Erythranthe guttata]
MARNNLRFIVVIVLLFTFVLSPRIRGGDAAFLSHDTAVISGAICPMGLCECCPYKRYSCSCCPC